MDIHSLQGEHHARLIEFHQSVSTRDADQPEGNQPAWFGCVGTYYSNTATITDVALPTGGCTWLW
jgi:hypothetical protein